MITLPPRDQSFIFEPHATSHFTNRSIIGFDIFQKEEMHNNCMEVCMECNLRVWVEQLSIFSSLMCNAEKQGGTFAWELAPSSREIWYNVYNGALISANALCGAL